MAYSRKATPRTASAQMKKTATPIAAGAKTGAKAGIKTPTSKITSTNKMKKTATPRSTTTSKELLAGSKPKLNKTLKQRLK